MRSRIPLVLTVVLFVAIALAYVLHDGFHAAVNEGLSTLVSNDRDRISAWTQGFGVWGPLVIIFALVLQIFLLFVPAMPIIIASVVAYGAVFGAIYAFIGLLLASAVGYGLGRIFSPAHLERFIGERTKRRISTYIDEYGIATVAIARFSPIVSTDAVSVVSGVLRMGFWRFMGASAVGTIGLVGAIALLGPDLGTLLPGLIILSIVSIVLYLAYIYYERRHRN